MSDQLVFDEIGWHLFLNTEDPAKAERIVRRVEQLVRVELDVISAQRYWKDPTLTEVQLRSQIQPLTEPSEATYVLLLTVQRLAHRVSTAGPQTYEGGKAEIIAVASGGFVEPGVNLMEASVRNFVPPGGTS